MILFLMWKVHCSPIRIRQKSQKLENIRFFAVIPPEHPLSHREMITQEDLKYERLIIHNFSRSKSEFPHDFPAGYLRNDLMQNISRTNDDAATIQTMVAAGMGIGIFDRTGG